MGQADEAPTVSAKTDWSSMTVRNASSAECWLGLKLIFIAEVRRVAQSIAMVTPTQTLP